jgi:hypothetical protein
MNENTSPRTTAEIVAETFALIDHLENVIVTTAAALRQAARSGDVLTLQNAALDAAAVLESTL